MTASTPEATIIVTTFDRHHLLGRAVESALGQQLVDLEVLVVDDGSPDPVELPGDPRLRVVRLARNGGHARARNVGLAEARGKRVTYLDDDDELLPDMIVSALDAAHRCDLPRPVAVLSGIEEVDTRGRVVKRRRPPTVPRGGHFGIQQKPTGTSFLTKNTTVVERSVLDDIGGWDESLRSLLYTELFLRLNPVCSILGLDRMGYRLHRHDGPRISTSGLRRESFNHIAQKHRELWELDPYRFARLA